MNTPRVWNVRSKRGSRGLLHVVGRLAGPANNLSLLVPVMAGAVSEGIRKDTGLMSFVEWPDMVTVSGKVVGMVAISRVSGATDLDVKVNCFAPASSLKSSRSVPSGSILEELGAEIDVGLLRERILDAMDWLTSEWQDGAYRRLAERVQPSISWMGQVVRVTTKSDQVTGKAQGLDEAGSLIVQGEKATLIVPPSEVESVVPVRPPPHSKSARRTLL